MLDLRSKSVDTSATFRGAFLGNLVVRVFL